MKAIALFLFVLIFTIKGYSQLASDSILIPLVDSNGGYVLIRQSELNEYQKPNKQSKVAVLNENGKLIGYFLGSKRKYVPLIRKKK